jgi:hypothetical protein
MNISESNSNVPIQRIPNFPGVIYQQNARLDELNTRLGERQITDQPLQPNYNPRPVPTKYSHFPIIDRRKAPPQTQLNNYLEYSAKTNFAPITSRSGPVDTYFRNIDSESVLRNQYFGLQHGAEQAVYVPESNSNLYGFTAVGRQESQTHPDLFNARALDQRPNPNLDPAIGSDRFFNHTRQQLRGLY